MLILSPVDRASEAPALIDAGAEELYAGYVPAFWTDAFGPVVSCNRRSFEEASVASLDELDAVVRAAALRDVALHVAVNAAPIPDGMVPRMVALAADLAQRGVRGVIVSDLALLRALGAARFRRFAVHASTLFSAFNGATVAFLRRAGADRVVLARELAVAEIEALVASSLSTPLVVIGLRGRCPNIEGFCTHLHDDPERSWPCELRYAKEWLGDGDAVPEGIREAIARHEGVDRRYSCGLCAVPLLERAGVHAVKVVGRGAGTSEKVSAVAAVREMREWGRETVPAPAACALRGKALYRRMHGRPCNPGNCYFPQFGPGLPEASGEGGGG